MKPTQPVPIVDFNADDSEIRRILDICPLGIAVISWEKKERLFVNQILADMFDAASVEQMLAQDIAETWVDQSALAWCREQHEKGKDLVNFEAERYRMDGSRWWVLLNTQKIMFQGELARINWHNDITERREDAQRVRRQRDELDTLNQEKDRLFSIIAHDLKNHLNGILGYSQLLTSQAGTLNPAKTPEYAGIIRQAADQAHHVLEELFDWSQSQMGRVAFEPGDLKIADAIDVNIAAYEPLASAKGVRITPGTVDAVDATADVRMVHTILRNLISNAVKFTEAGGEIIVSAQTAGARVAVSVADTGVGISPDLLNWLMNSDEALSSLGTDGEEGTGFGFCLCKTFAQRHGEGLRVESRPGEGAKFTFTLPLARP